MRLIDANTLKENCYIKLGNDTIGVRQYVMFHEIDDAPTIDAVQVVRCKDCKHLRLDSDFVEGRYCSIRNVNGGGFCKDEDFCSYGKHKENGEA